MKANSPLVCVVRELKTPRVVAMLVLAGCFFIAITGCRRSERSHANIDPSGVYHLVAVDSQTVPCTLTHEGAAITVKSGTLTINTNGTCLSLTTFSVAGHPEIHREVKATYTVNGAELTMKWERAGTTKGKVDGDTFTMNNEGMVFSYQQQAEASLP